MNREAVYSALFNKLRDVAPFRVTSRRLQHWSDVAPADQPALFIAQRNEVVNPVPGLPYVWELRVDVYVYANTRDDRTRAPAEILNPIVDAVVAALAPSPVTGNKLTLGGLVEHCWIEGEIVTDEGVMGDQGVVIIPVVLKVSN